MAQIASPPYLDQKAEKLNQELLQIRPRMIMNTVATAQAMRFLN